MRTANATHRIRAAILFVIGVQNEQHIQCTFQHGIRLILQLAGLEHHVEEVAGKTQIVIGIGIGQTNAMTIGEGGYRSDFGQQAINLFAARFSIKDIFRFGIKRRKRADGADENAHRVRVVMKAIQHLFDVFVDEGVMRDIPRPIFQLRFGRQFAVQDQIGSFQIIAAFGELFNRIAAITQNAQIAVN